MKQKTKPDHSSWISVALQKRTRCGACNDEAAPVIREILQAIHEAKAFKIGTPTIYERLSEIVPGFSDRIGYDTLRKHLTSHEPLWHRYRGPKADSK